MANWFYQYNGKSVGPITETQMLEWVRQKTVMPTHLVRTEDSSEWHEAGTCRELFAESVGKELEAAAATVQDKGHGTSRHDTQKLH